MTSVVRFTTHEAVHAEFLTLLVGLVVVLAAAQMLQTQHCLDATGVDAQQEQRHGVFLAVDGHVSQHENYDENLQWWRNQTVCTHKLMLMAIILKPSFVYFSSKVIKWTRPLCKRFWHPLYQLCALVYILLNRWCHERYFVPHHITWRFGCMFCL